MYSDPYEKFLHKPVERRAPIAPRVPRSRVGLAPAEEIEAPAEEIEAPVKRAKAPWTRDPDVASLLRQFHLVVGLAARPSAPPEGLPKIKNLIVLVSRVSSIPVLEITSQRRTKLSAKARQIVVWLARKFTERSLPDIGWHVGGRDHTTVLHSLTRVDLVVADLGLAGPADSPEAWACLLWNADWPPLAGRGRHGRKAGCS